MSGLLRRIKRSRPADAGEPLPEGQAAAPEGAAPATEPSTASTEPGTPVATESAASEQPTASQPASEPAKAKPAEKPVLLADPNTPAGLDPADAPMRPPAGRRGRLRRRLRYLRRARELMLRDLGGLLYEVHRTGGGDIEAHGNIIRAKVGRIAGVDAEIHALETALATSRPASVVFQPGVGGTCATCGELYGSAARFCANCGAPIGGAPAPATAPGASGSAAQTTPAPATRESVFGSPARQHPTQALSSGDPLRVTPALTPTKRDEPAVAASGAAQTAADDPGAGESPVAPAAGSEQPTTPIAGADEPAPAEGATTAGAEDAVVSDAAPAADEPVVGDAEPAADAALVTDADEAPTADPAPAADADEAPTADPAPAADADEAPTADADEAPTADPAPAADADEAPTAEPAPAADAEAPPAADAGERDAAPAEEPDAPRAPGVAGEEKGNPFSGLRNGREEGHAPPELSSGDPLVTRESRS